MIKKNLLKTVLVFFGIAVLLTAIIAFTVIAGRRDPMGSENTDGAKEVAVSDQPFARPFTVLVAGKDSAAGLCDVLMLVRVDAASDLVTILQIPRDTYAEYTEGTYKKINGAQTALGGTEALCGFLSDSFGIAIDGYVSVDMDVIPLAVDTLGGVEIELDTPLVYNDPAQELSINIPSGRQTLDGVSALQFIRYRSGYVRGDIGRMDAQKLFLASFARKIKGLNAFELAHLAAAMLPKLDTNISLSKALTLGKVASSVSEENIVFVTLPGEEVVAQSSGVSYYSLSAPATKEILCAYFGARAEDFDKNAVFKNERYESFCKCYENNAPYKLYTASSLCENGINIDKH